MPHRNALPTTKEGKERRWWKAESKSSSKKVRRKSAKRIAAGYESKLRRTGKGVTAQHSTAAQREPNIGVSE